MTPQPPAVPSSEPRADDDFYVGYDPPMPSGVARRVTRVVAALAVVAIASAAGALVTHRQLTPAVFDYGRPQTVTGILRRTPYPALRTASGDVLLVGRGKAGAETSMAGVPDGPVMLHGTRIERRGRRMVEVVPGSVRVAGDAGRATAGAEGAAASSVEVTLRGEIVDSKCFLGVMNPGEGTVHRDCARVCLRGGIPPMLLVRGAPAEEALILLVDASGRPVGRQLAELSGVPVEIRGRLTRGGEQQVLAVDPAAVVRLPR